MEQIFYLVAFILAVNLASVAQADSRFSHYIALDEEGGFNLWWLPQKDTITFKTEASQFMRFARKFR